MRFTPPFIALTLAGSLGCVGDSSTPPDGGMDSSTIGGLGQPCYADDTCNAGLKCQILSSTSTVCIPGGGDAAPDSTVNDSGSNDAAADGGSEAGCVGPGKAIGNCMGGSTSEPCIDGGSITCTDPLGSCKLSNSWYGNCTTAKDCQTGVCCLQNISITSLGTCTSSVQMNAGSPFTMCTSTCPAQQLCVMGSECPSGSCATVTQFVVGGVSVNTTFGLCQQ